MGLTRVEVVFSLLLVTTTALQSHLSRHNVAALGTRLLESTIARGQGIAGSNASTSQIELGIFEQALRESILHSQNTIQKDDWSFYLQQSTASMVKNLTNIVADDVLPLDRLAIGSSMIYQTETTKRSEFRLAISSLEASVVQQQRNANGGLWYYADANNLTAYHNLSYLDGMFSYAPFAILAPNVSHSLSDEFGPASALEQIQILYDICKISSGLTVHGYDASRTHSWANKENGASPVVWGRSMAWFTLGIVNSLEILQRKHTINQNYVALKEILNALVIAQLAASDHGLRLTGRHGVWQVVDHPGAVFEGNKNFIEASASCMTVYSLLRSVRAGFIESLATSRHATATAEAMYHAIIEDFLIEDEDGGLSLNGTSSVASLSGEVDYVVSSAFAIMRRSILN
nr:unsaturated rhamnogalacturonyl hydrolase yter [Quercus suber]